MPRIRERLPADARSTAISAPGPESRHTHPQFRPPGCPTVIGMAGSVLFPIPFPGAALSCDALSRRDTSRMKPKAAPTSIERSSLGAPSRHGPFAKSSTDSAAAQWKS
jgi:hypothetical protein